MPKPRSNGPLKSLVRERFQGGEQHHFAPRPSCGMVASVQNRDSPQWFSHQVLGNRWRVAPAKHDSTLEGYPRVPLAAMSAVSAGVLTHRIESILRPSGN